MEQKNEFSWRGDEDRMGKLRERKGAFCVMESENNEEERKI